MSASGRPSAWPAPLLLAAAAALCAALLAVPARVSAKTDGYILSGGDLGELGHHFYIHAPLHEPGDEVARVAAPAFLPSGAAYDLLAPWPFTAAAQIEDGRPLARYYPVAGLVHNPASGEWLRPSGEMRLALEKALSEARRKLERGELKPAILAAFHVYAYDTGVFIVNPNIGSTYRIAAADFPIEALAATITGASTASRPAPLPESMSYRIDASPAGVGLHAWVYYNPPVGDRPGFVASAETGAQRRFWPTTPEFDREFAAAARTTAPGGAPLPLPYAPAARAASEGARISLPSVGQLMALPAPALLGLLTLTALALNAASLLLKRSTEADW